MKRPDTDGVCPCGSGFPFAACCGPHIAGLAPAPTALALMRSRYTAHALGHAPYLLATWHHGTRPATVGLAPEQRWLGLKIRAVAGGQAGDEQGTVEFVARYKLRGRGHRLHEVSRFVFEDGRWLYVDGTIVSGP